MQTGQETSYVDVSPNAYTYEDHLADMGNAHSSQPVSEDAPIAQEREGVEASTAIGRLQAITGAKAADGKVKPRGPKADAADFAFIQVSGRIVDRRLITTPSVALPRSPRGTLSLFMFTLMIDAPQPSCSYRADLGQDLKVECLWLQRSLSKLLLFDRLDPSVQTKIIEHTWVRQVPAGEILIQEGETGLAATELYIVKNGNFEVSG